MASPVLEELAGRLGALPPDKKAQAVEQAVEATKRLRWIPNPGPQTEAYFSKADVLLYGGEPSGGKTDLGLGLAFNCHQRSLVMRRQYTDLGFLTERAKQINGGTEGYNGSPPPSLRIGDKRIDFGAAAKVGDEQHWMGNPHDLIFLDEACHFIRTQVDLLMGWNRTTVPGQRCRVVLATNPPLTVEGEWVIEMFAPWLDERYPHPAKPGELRWVVRDENDRDRWVDGPEPVMVRDKLVKPKSRTYIPASVADNPHQSEEDYQSTLDAMPEVYRSVLLGHFKRLLRDQERQVIPTDWVRQAQARWKHTPPDGIPMCAIGVDVAQGGTDETVLAMRHDGWYAPLVRIPGKLTPFGSDVAGAVIARRKDKALVMVDLGGGYGGSAFEHLRSNDVEVQGFKGAESTNRRSRDGKLHFTNTRSAAYWLFREALDPGQPGGSPIALPDDPHLLADLVAPTFETTPNGIKLEPKEKVQERLGRSPDGGDAVVMAWFSGPKEVNSALEWADQREARRTLTRRPRVILDPKHHR